MLASCCYSLCNNLNQHSLYGRHTIRPYTQLVLLDAEDAEDAVSVAVGYCEVVSHLAY